MFIIVQDDLVLKPEQPGGGRRVGSGRILAREGGAAPRPEEFSLKPARLGNSQILSCICSRILVWDGAELKV
jgi:hypothetical protein